MIFRSAASGQYEMYALPVPPRTAANAYVARSASLAASAAPSSTQLTNDGRAKQHADWGVKAGSAPSTVTLRVSTQGKGRVSGPRISCLPDCAGTFVIGKVVRLTAVPGSGQRFKKWTGACSGTQRTCTLRLGKSKSATAAFVPTT